MQELQKLVFPSGILLDKENGNYYSRLVVKAYYFAKNGEHLPNEYKGYYNHLIYDCCSDFPRPLSDVEAILMEANSKQFNKTEHRNRLTINGKNIIVAPNDANRK